VSINMVRKTFYQTDDAGYYTGPVLGFLDPEQEDRWMAPFGAYEDEPPAVGEHEIQRRVDIAWVIVPNYLGFIYWTADRVKHEITELGISPPEGFLLADPGPSAEEIAEKARLNLIKRAEELLQKSNATVLNCYEAGVPVPADWRAWRASLKAIAATGVGVIEDAPEAPAGV